MTCTEGGAMTDRMRRHRERLASGRVVLPVEVHLSDLADALVEAGWLEAWDQEDRKAIRRGLERLIDHLVSVGGDA
jgi:endonuclease YncB( thermonuclease family)